VSLNEIEKDTYLIDSKHIIMSDLVDSVWSWRQMSTSLWWGRGVTTDNNINVTATVYH